MPTLDAGSAFAMKVTVRIGVFLALMFSFRWIVYGLAVVSGSLAYGVILIVGFYLKPLITIGFVASMIHPCRQRMRSLGVSPNWGLLVPTLLLIDVWILMFLGPDLTDSKLTGLRLDFGLLKGIQSSCLAIMLAIAMSIAKPMIEASSLTTTRTRAMVLLGSVVVALITFRILAWVSAFVSRSSLLLFFGFNPTLISVQALVSLLCGASAIWVARYSRSRLTV